MNMELSRRSFMIGAGAGLAGTSLGALGFGEIEAAHALTIRPFKLAQTKEVRSQCPYCAVCCGMLIFSAENKEEKGKMTRNDDVFFWRTENYLFASMH